MHEVKKEEGEGAKGDNHSTHKYKRKGEGGWRSSSNKLVVVVHKGRKGGKKKGNKKWRGGSMMTRSVNVTCHYNMQQLHHRT
jgi:hypothetical protein